MVEEEDRADFANSLGELQADIDAEGLLAVLGELDALTLTGHFGKDTPLDKVRLIDSTRGEGGEVGRGADDKTVLVGLVIVDLVVVHEVIEGRLLADNANDFKHLYNIESTV